MQQHFVHIVLERPHDAVRLGAENITQQQLVAIPVRGQRLVDGNLAPPSGDLAQVHEDLVLDTPRRIRRQLDVFVAPVGAHRFDESDRSNRN